MSLNVNAILLRCLRLRFHDAVSLTISVAAIWTAWWVWSFILRPAMNPSKPKQLPYLIPFVGHSYNMWKDSNRLFTYGRCYFGNTREVFSITVLGKELYIITSPQDILSVYKSTKAIGVDPVVKGLFMDFGLTASTVDKFFEPRWARGKHFKGITLENFRLQMRPGEKFNKIRKAFSDYIDESLSWSNLASDSAMVISQPLKDERIVSVFHWSYEVLVDASTRAFFGDALYKVEPDFLKTFLVFDAQSWKLLLHYPRFAAKGMYAAKDKAEAAFAKYLALPDDQRKGSVWLIQQLEDGMKTMDIDKKSQAPLVLLMIYHLININTYRACFWCLAYLLYDENLLGSIKSEVEGAFDRGTLDIEYLIACCPLLNSFFDEIMRYTCHPIGHREVMSDTVIGGKSLQPGKGLLMPYQQAHCGPEVFGPVASTFRATRFLNNSLNKSTSYRPFGGGTTHCPGRFMARRGVLQFVVLIIKRFDIKLEPGMNGKPPGFPRMGDTIPAGGVLGPVSGDDVMIRVKLAKG